MPNYSTSILESKLKRHKISYSTENGKIIIGKPKVDYTTLIGLVALPIISGIAFSFMLFSNNFQSDANKGRIIAGIVFLFGTGFFSLSRVGSKKQSNDNIKTLDSNSIKVQNEFGKYVFDYTNTKGFTCSFTQINKETYEGNLFLIDNEDRKHQILGFDDENEKYVKDDLNWFAEFLFNHIGVINQKPEV